MGLVSVAIISSLFVVILIGLIGIITFFVREFKSEKKHAKKTNEDFTMSEWYKRIGL
tara:strand:- start:21858 stop:22028 length:171 start_codon:yes stop_codon:yes gene_type:complete